MLEQACKPRRVKALFSVALCQQAAMLNQPVMALISQLPTTILARKVTNEPAPCCFSSVSVFMLVEQLLVVTKFSPSASCAKKNLQNYLAMNSANCRS